MDQVFLNSEEVRNPLAKIFVLVAVITAAILAFATIGFVILPTLLIVTIGAAVLTLPLHFILRLCGRRGLYVRRGNHHVWTFTGALNRE